MNFTDAKREFDSKYESEKEYKDCFLSIHLKTSPPR